MPDKIDQAIERVCAYFEANRILALADWAERHGRRCPDCGLVVNRDGECESCKDPATASFNGKVCPECEGPKRRWRYRCDLCNERAKTTHEGSA